MARTKHVPTARAAEPDEAPASTPVRSTAVDDKTIIKVDDVERSPAPAATAPAAAASTGQRVSKLPVPLQFPLVAILSFSISSLGYSFLNEYSKGELATIARSLQSSQEVALLASWRLLELALGWFGKYDSYDLAALNVLSHGPPFFLMTAFYGIRPGTAASCLAIDVISSFLPFLLLRPLSGAHSAAPTVANREIIVDRSIQAYTTLLAGAIYSVVLFFSYQTYLPKALVLYFEGIPSIEPAHASMSVVNSAPAASLALLIGLAARTFIFTPYEATGPVAEDDEMARFDPVSATLAQTLYYNLWGYTAQTKVLITRTAVAMLLTGVNTYLSCAMSINGVEWTGAAIYASVWVLAAFLTGVGLGVVGRD